MSNLPAKIGFDTVATALHLPVTGSGLLTHSHFTTCFLAPMLPNLLGRPHERQREGHLHLPHLLDAAAPAVLRLPGAAPSAALTARTWISSTKTTSRERIEKNQTKTNYKKKFEFSFSKFSGKSRNNLCKSPYYEIIVFHFLKTLAKFRQNQNSA